MSQNMTTALKAFKHACLAYSASPIPYNNKNYHVSELLSVKASVVAKCQRMVRENLFGTRESYGKDIRNLNNEKGFVIEPLMEAAPVVPSRNRAANDLLDDVMKSHNQGAGDTVYNPSQDFGATSAVNSVEEVEGAEGIASILKVSRYPEDIVEDFKAINSFGASIAENDIETVNPPHSPTAQRLNQTIVTLKDELLAQGSSKNGDT